MNLKKNWTWACDHFKTGNLSVDNFKKILELDGSTPEPAILSGDAGQRIPCFDSCQLITTLMCNMCAIINAQYQFSCAPKLARKCEIEHWCPCGADGRAVYGDRMGLRPRALRARGAPLKMKMLLWYFFKTLWRMRLRALWLVEFKAKPN